MSQEQKKQPNESSNNNNTSSQKRMTEQRFAPKQPGKVHDVTCNQSKDHRVPHAQQTCDHGLDTAD